MDADYLIAGAGLAGLSLAVALADAGATADRRVVIIDPRTVFPRDRTWCYWDVDPTPHPFAACVSRRWTRWRIAHGTAEIDRSADGLAYCHLPADAFYAAALQRLSRDPNVDLRLGRSVASLYETSTGVTATLDDGSTIRASHCFDSRPPVAANQRFAVGARKGADCEPLVRSYPTESVRDVHFSQQFIGHFVQTNRPSFDPAAVTLMDFRAEQTDGAIRFVYVLPFDECHALIEATTISESPVPDAEHEVAIDEYLRRIIGIDHWQVTATERGAIPMNTAPRPVTVSPHVWRIGLNGGMAKPSTGYAFLAVQRFSRAAAALIARHGAGPLPTPPAVRSTPATALDRIFLARLRRRPDLAPALFARLFARADPAALVRFLSDRATPADVLAVVAALPKRPFAAEAVRSWRLWARIALRRKTPTLIAGGGSPGLRPETSPPPAFLANHTGASAPGY